MTQLQLNIPTHAEMLAPAFRRATRDLREFSDFPITLEDSGTRLPSWKRIGNGADAVVYQNRREPVVVKLPSRSVAYPEAVLHNVQDRQETAQYSALIPVLLSRWEKTSPYVPEARLRFARIKVTPYREDGSGGGEPDEVTTPVVLQEYVDMGRSDDVSRERPDVDAVLNGSAKMKNYRDKLLWHHKVFPKLSAFAETLKEVGMRVIDPHGDNWANRHPHMVYVDTGRFLYKAGVDEQTRAETAAQRMLGASYRALRQWVSGAGARKLYNVLPDSRTIQQGRRGGLFVRKANMSRQYIRRK